MHMIQAGATDRSIEFTLLNTDGTLKTDAVAADLTAQYRRGLTGTLATISLSDLSALTDAHSDGGLKHVFAGRYRLDLPDAAVAAGVDTLELYATGTDLVAVFPSVLLTTGDPNELSTLTAVQVWVAITAEAGNFIADHTLRRSWTSAAASANGDTKGFRSLLGMCAKLVNRVAVSGSTLTVYEADDATALGTQTLATDSDAEPIVSVDTD
ncbi:MAG: hypothetical protein ACPHCN_18690 [Mycobacterium sp.]